MHLKSVRIKNFRLLENIEVTFDNKVNVIVGPNASGKTTILDGIRLVKAMLAPRTPNEATQVLFSLGAGSPHMPQQLIPSALARDLTKALEIRTQYEFSDNELIQLSAAIPKIAVDLVQAQIGQGFANPSARLAFLSSPMGKAALETTTNEITQAVTAAKTSKACRLGMIFDPKSGQISPEDPIAPILFSYIEQSHQPHEALFTYFPADRALPIGEQPVQLGAADAAQQLESYNSQPQMKYLRLKNTIFSTVILSDEGRKALEADFNHIFSRVLKGRKLLGFGTNQVGMLSIKVQDTETSHVFDLDGMSSGEKGLILTCLLISRTLARGGIVLLDEPELHLNPAICKDLLTFFVDTYVNPNGVQLITCSHSPEILMGAFDRDECSVFHLESGSKLSKVRRKDEDIISGALRRLGSSEIDGLLYKATIFVEGENDVEILQAGFDELLRKYKLNDRGGRREIEKLVNAIQDAEKEGKTPSRHFVIFDHDEEPSALNSSGAARILQWDRRCLENYLFEFDVLTDLLKNDEITKGRSPIVSITDTIAMFRKLAMNQLGEFVVRRVYQSYAFESPDIKRGEKIPGNDFAESAEQLFIRLARIREQLSPLSQKSWKDEFIERCRIAKTELEPLWDEKWTSLCDGKRVFKDLQQSVPLRMSIRHFKRRVMSDMRVTQCSLWLEVSRNLVALLT